MTNELPKISAHVDYVNLSGKYLTAPPRTAQEFERAGRSILSGMLGRAINLELGTQGGRYPFTVQDTSSGLVAAFSIVENQGYQVTATGKVCTRIDGHLQSILATSADHDMNLTRVDVALDVMDATETPLQVFQRLLVTGVPYNRKLRYEQSEDGDSCYIGSRTSDFMLRIYRKDVREGVSDMWVRYELECKHDASHAMLPFYRELVKIGVDKMFEFFKPDAVPPDLARARQLGGATVDLPSLHPATKSARLKWLLDTVIPSVQKLQASDPQEVTVFLKALSEALD